MSNLRNERTKIFPTPFILIPKYIKLDRIIYIKEQKEHVYVRCLIIWNTFVLTAYYAYLKSWELHSYGLEAILNSIADNVFCYTNHQLIDMTRTRREAQGMQQVL